MKLPPPSADALFHQQKLLTQLYSRCQQTGGKLSFAELMNQALYAPGLGYYSAGMHKFGGSGDFVTAPEISPLFAECLGAQCLEILHPLKEEKRYILELGAGSGRMAATLIHFLTEHQALPSQYWILEVSADLKARQQAFLRKHCPHFFEHIVWLDALPSSAFQGIILGNEVIDAMPVHLFQIAENGEILEGFVTLSETETALFYDKPTTPHLNQAVQDLQKRLPTSLAPGYTSEINLSLAAWIATLSTCLTKGIMLFIDYGFPSHEYYHPSRSMGTLMCHYRHYAHSDPLQYIGLQDITAHVDFTALAFAGHACGLNLAGFTHQAAFLIGNGLAQLFETKMTAQTEQRFSLSKQIQVLTSPHEMGELFKVIAFSKDLNIPLQGFTQIDHRHRLSPR